MQIRESLFHHSRFYGKSFLCKCSKCKFSHSYGSTPCCLWTVNSVCLCTGALTTALAAEKYFHPPANDAEIYIPKIWTLWCKWRVISDFGDTTLRSKKDNRRPSGFLCSSFLMWWKWHVICCKLCTVPTAKEEKATFNKANHVIWSLFGHP